VIEEDEAEVGVGHLLLVFLFVAVVFLLLL
jgi:hypothetical protein